MALSTAAIERRAELLTDTTCSDAAPLFRSSSST